jgi:hypothetical protein
MVYYVSTTPCSTKEVHMDVSTIEDKITNGVLHRTYQPAAA